MRTHLQHNVPCRGGALPRALLTITLAVGACLLWLSGAGAQSASVHRKSSTVEAKRVELTGGVAATTFVLGLSAGVRAEIFTLANPYRVVVDLPDVAFHLPDGAGQKGKGLISAYRYGLLAEGKARVVIDATGPVIIKRAQMTAKGGHAVDLVVDLVPTSAKSFGSGTGAGRAEKTAVRADPPRAAPALKKDRLKPIILIDAGHGGIDPGAASVTNLKEKTVVLAVARALRTQLSASGRYDVKMTRSTDVFISLDQRLEMSRDLDTDLFISLHAELDRPEELCQNRAWGDRLYAVGASVGRGSAAYGRKRE